MNVYIHFISYIHRLLKRINSFIGDVKAPYPFSIAYRISRLLDEAVGFFSDAAMIDYFILLV